MERRKPREGAPAPTPVNIKNKFGRRPRMGLMGASPSALFFFSCRQCNMIYFCPMVTVGTHTDSNSGVAAFTFFFLACGNILSCSVFTLWPRGKFSDCSTKGGLPHRRRRNLKDPRPRCKKQRVAGGQIDGGRKAPAVLTTARSRKKITRACPRPLSPKPGRRRGATEGSGGPGKGRGPRPGGA